MTDSRTNVTITMTVETFFLYTVYVNPSIEAVKSYAEDNPNVYIFMLYMDCPLEHIPDWSVEGDGDWMNRVLHPCYVSSADEAKELVEMTLKERSGRWRMV